ncbi:hypothetical protein ACFQ2M_06915 [Kitasatospora saccharophila]|uniref:hypothetical protein n=1 Tax=Kitasatospora saccharophila TaxID=407973 RepID=UPI00363B70E1
METLTPDRARSRSEAEAVARSGDWPIYHPAGLDVQLRRAVDDLSAGRWLSTGRLLAATREPGLWMSRTQVLALVAARSAVLDDWAREEPSAPGLGLLRTRVLVERALSAARQGRPEAWRMEGEARQACWEASSADPSDPVPWVCLLALAVVDRGQLRPEHRVRPTDPLLPGGPWGLLDEALRRDPGNREAHHRMYRYWQELNRHAVAGDFVHAVMPSVAGGSPLAALPLYLSVDQYRSLRGQDGLVRRQWMREPHYPRIQFAYESWKSSEAGGGRSRT